MVKENRLRVLHISDLHLTSNKKNRKKANFDQGLVLDPLIERVKKDSKEGLKPEIVVITGDIAYKGIKTEYRPANDFLDWLWPADRSRCRAYLTRNSVLLCGHLHDTAGGYFSDHDGEFFHFQAGSSYMGSESSWPARFQYITFDWEKNLIRLDFRKYAKEIRQWRPDSEKGDDGKKTYPMFETGRDEPERTDDKKDRIKKRIQEDESLERYTAAALIEHRHLSAKGFETTFRHPIELDSVYVNMRARIQAHGFEYSKDGKRRMKEIAERDSLSSIGIKGAFKALRQHNIKDMVILGDPGAGKTTLLKYILVMLIEGRAHKKVGLKSNLIPFFAPLRELKTGKKKSGAFTGVAEDLPQFIGRVCNLGKYAVSPASLKNLLDEGKGIILFDGLDEVADEDARIAVCRWIDRARREFVKTRFIVTSRYAGYIGTSRLEGNVLELSILEFTPEEVKVFLTRWFETVEVVLHPGEDEPPWRQKGREKAGILIDKIMESEYLKKLAVNPLLLQIIALVHRDRGTLPQRRVELYDECTNVLLEKWDMAKGLDVKLTASEARQVLQPLALWLHEKDQRRSETMDKIIEVIEDPLEEIGKSSTDARALLLNIRDRSGIFMGYSEREYGFTHLSFQEYLAAEEIRNSGKTELLVKKYGRRWWREVTLLCLALNNPSVFGSFLKKIIPTPHFKSEISLITDALNDSITKPSKPLLNALANENLEMETRLSAIRLLRRIGGAKVEDGLTKAVEFEDRKIAVSAYEALEELGAAEGVTPPEAETIGKVSVNRIDNSEMVLIPSGPFLFGSREDDHAAHSDEKPQRIIELPDFYMDVYPVTNSQYCEFLNQTKPGSRELQKWIYLAGEIEDEKCRISAENEQFVIEKGYKKHPVIYVSHFGAAAYAEWAGKRIPTELEWEKAARGTEGLIYPWGNEFEKDRCNSEESGSNGTTPAGKFPDGKSPYGCHDMSGNVWEWTDSFYDDAKSRYVLRGGSWDGDSVNCRCAYRSNDHPDFRLGSIGFRCARTVNIRQSRFLKKLLF